MLSVLSFPKEDSLGKGKHRLLWDIKLYIDAYMNIYMVRSTSKNAANENTGSFMISLVSYLSTTHCLIKKSVNLFFMVRIIEDEIDINSL